MEHAPPPPFVLPVWATNCQEGRSIDGLSGWRIEHTTSPAPPPGGVQSSQPTFPGEFEQSGILMTVFQVHAVPVSTGELLPSQDIELTGIATGRRAQYRPWLE